jgi:hypothetical protein
VLITSKFLTQVPQKDEVGLVPTKLALGVTGGFNVSEQQEELSTEYFLTVKDGADLSIELRLPDDRLPAPVVEAIRALQVISSLRQDIWFITSNIRGNAGVQRFAIFLLILIIRKLLM